MKQTSFSTKLRNLSVGCLVLLFSLQACQGQNVYKDYVRDRHAQYSPFDYQNRGLIYKMQTGHAGCFGNCDDDRQKMVSPYIDWHCRKPDCNLCIRFMKDMCTDIFRKSQRFADGAGDCVIGNCQDGHGNCNQCQQPSNDCKCRGNRYTQNLPSQGYPEAVRNELSSSVSSPAYTQELNSTRAQLAELRSRTSSSYAQQPLDPPAALLGSNRNGSSTNQTASREAYFQDRSNQLNSQATYSSIYDRESQKQAARTASKTPEYSNRLASKRLSGNQPLSGLRYSAQESESLDPRYESPQKGTVPASRFDSLAKEINRKQNESQTQSGQSSKFRLSGSNGVYQRPQFFNRSATNSSEPVQDQQSGPQRFQFQQIGGSTNR